MNTFIKVDDVEPKLETIVKAIKHVTGVDIRTNETLSKITRLKKIYYKIAKGMTSLSMKEMARYVKTTNQATVIYHLKDVNELLEDNKEYREIYDKVMYIVNGSMNIHMRKDNGKIIYYIDEKVKNKEEFNAVDREVSSGLPEHIVRYLQEFTEEELNEVYENRILPFGRMLGKVG